MSSKSDIEGLRDYLKRIEQLTLDLPHSDEASEIQVLASCCIEKLKFAVSDYVWAKRELKNLKSNLKSSYDDSNWGGID